MCDFFSANARMRDGTREALEMLDDPKKFDVLRANLLIAKGIPACSHLDIQRVDKWYSEVAAKIEKYMEKMRATPEGQKFLGEKGEIEFKLCAANDIIARVQNIDYVKDDKVLPEHPWHLFAHGVSVSKAG